MKAVLRLSWAALACASVACGKKGPPLPPLVRLPAAPLEVAAERRGAQVEVRLRSPSANTDGSRPADVSRIDVYAFTGDQRLSDEEWVTRGQKVGSITVRRPPEDAASDDGDGEAATTRAPAPAGAPGGAGIDQGAVAAITETVGPGLVPARRGPDGAATLAVGSAAGERWTPLGGQFASPLLGVPPLGPRTYVAVGVTRRGRRGPFSARASVLLGPAPDAPSSVAIAYTETSLTIRWASVAGDATARSAEASKSADDATKDTGAAAVLTSRVLLLPDVRTGYHVYEAPSTGPVRRLTAAPTTELSFVDQRMTWGEERCYVVRGAAIADGRTVEGDPSPRQCVTLTDTFAPAAPNGLTAIASEGAISLIWEPNTEADLAGYRVLHDAGVTGTFAPVTVEPIKETTFRDTVGAGVVTAYVVEAVDKAGNASPRSTAVQETAR